jgi:hypothetical protein
MSLVGPEADNKETRDTYAHDHPYGPLLAFDAPNLVRRATPASIMVSVADIHRLQSVASKDAYLRCATSPPPYRFLSDP